MYSLQKGKVFCYAESDVLVATKVLVHSSPNTHVVAKTTKRYTVPDTAARQGLTEYPLNVLDVFKECFASNGRKAKA